MNFNFFQPVLLIKIITLIVIGFYMVFAFVISTQIKAMENIINLPHASSVFKTAAIFNIVLAISLFILAVVIL